MTAAGLSAVLKGEFSHDSITRFLSGDVCDYGTLRKLVKHMVREMERDGGALVFDCASG